MPHANGTLADTAAEPAMQNGRNGSTDSPDASVEALDPVLAAHITSLRLLLTAWLSHFRSLGYVKESTMDMLDKSVLRKTLQLSVKDAQARLVLGTSVPVWTDVLQLLRLAVPSLESRSYATIPDPYDTSAAPTATIYDGPSAAVIVANHASLLRDLQRLNNALCIGRNVLTAGPAVQNLAAQLAVDREVCCLVNLSVKITARGYDGEGTGVEEEKWQAVVNEYKKLLITCLQFLSNLVTLNERLKLMLWVELFDGASEGNIPGWPDPAGAVRPLSSVRSGPSDEAWLAQAAAPLGLAKSRESFRQRLNSVEAQLHTESMAKSGQGAAELDLALPALPGIPKSPDALKKLPDAAARRSRSKTPVRRPSDSSALATSPLPAQSRQGATLETLQKLVAEESTKAMASSPHTLFVLWLAEHRAGIEEQLRARSSGGQPPTPEQVVRHAKEMFDSQMQDERNPLAAKYVEAFGAWSQDPQNWGAIELMNEYLSMGGLGQPPPPTSKLSQLLGEMADAADAAASGHPLVRPDDGTLEHGAILNATNLLPLPNPSEPPHQQMETAEDGIKKLEEGKRELLKRLEGVPDPLDDQAALSPASPVEVDDEDGAFATPSALPARPPSLDAEDDVEASEDLISEEEDEQDEESSEEDYDRIPGEDGRGLLTDVPLILGPNEIEVLPMIVMSGIVADAAQVEAKRKEPHEQLQIFFNMYTIRCHLLLAQENGRNLLRELLIFVAAWDLREEELYFKFMVKIMESILMHGLMPFAYSAFKESKDIISPAQAVIMKLLTKIFHSRQAFISTPDNAHLLLQAQPLGGQTADPTRTIVSTLFSEFRSNIIPQICALIFLQGQIRAGKASMDDFPLNLWDMERMYEGVYQYLEFFAILTDHDEWKALMADWEVVSELVTLLRELDAGIGKRTLARQPPAPAGSDAADLDATPILDQSVFPQEQLQPPTTVAVERPYSPLPTAPSGLPGDDLGADSGLESPASEAPASPALHEEPADFEWRNLKKLCVLVLSSLVWKNPTLQEQVLRFGGIETILRCCAIDEHNPYIREHAIMCLRFCVEGNDKVREAVRQIVSQPGTGGQAPQADDAHDGTATLTRTNGVDSLAGGVQAVGLQGDGAGAAGATSPPPAEPLRVPPEVLDAHGYETFMDSKGQVGLRRKEGGPAAVAEGDSDEDEVTR